MDDIFTPVTGKLFCELQAKSTDVLTETACGYLFNTILNDEDPDPISDYTHNNISETMINKKAFKIVRNMYNLPKMSIGLFKSFNKSNNMNEEDLMVLSDGINARIYKTDDLSLKQISLINNEELDPSCALKEIFILGMLSHPHILNLKSFMLRDDSVYLVFDPTTTNLNTLIHGNKKEFFTTEWSQCYLEGISTNKIQLHYMKDLLEGINHMHRMGIIHRDIKPNNLLIMTDNRLCICDFGTACVLLYNKIGSEASNIKGTYQYTDIELHKSKKKNYTQTTDLWSAGCTIIEMITSIPLVTTKSPELIIKELELVLNTQLSCIKNTILRSLLIALLSLDPQKRVSCTHALSELNKI